jgi:hypothetical protein
VHRRLSAVFALLHHTRTHKMNSFDTDFCYLAINSAYLTAQSFDFSEFVYALLASFEANAEDGESITY